MSRVDHRIVGFRECLVTSRLLFGGIIKFPGILKIFMLDCGSRLWMKCIISHIQKLRMFENGEMYNYIVNMLLALFTSDIVYHSLEWHLATPRTPNSPKWPRRISRTLLPLVEPHADEP